MSSFGRVLDLDFHRPPSRGGIRAISTSSGSELPVRSHLDDSISTTIVSDPNFIAIWEDIEKLLALKPGWDGYGAKRIDPVTARFGWGIAVALQTADMVSPFIAPLAYGGLQIEWENDFALLEVEIRAPFDVHVLYEDRVTKHEIEKLLTEADLTELNNIVVTARERLRVPTEQRSEARRA